MGVNTILLWYFHDDFYAVREGEKILFFKGVVSCGWRLRNPRASDPFPSRKKTGSEVARAVEKIQVRGRLGAAEFPPPSPSPFLPDAKNWLRKDWEAGEEGDDRGRDGWMASPTQWTCLRKLREMVKDREAWRAAVHGFSGSRRRLSDWKTSAGTKSPERTRPKASRLARIFSDKGARPPRRLEVVPELPGDWELPLGDFAGKVLSQKPLSRSSRKPQRWRS